MDVRYGNGKTEYGPGVKVNLTGDEVANAIYAYLVAHGVHVSGPRTVTVNGSLCDDGSVTVDPSGFVMFNGERWSGRGRTVSEYLKRWIDDFVESADPELNPNQCAARFADAVNQAFL